MYFNINLMNSNNPARLKAAFLLIIFYLNMIIAVGCSLGLCICCKPGYQGRTAALADKGFCHLHHDKSAEPLKSKGCADNCCNESVIKFLKADKSFRECLSAPNGVPFTIFISYFDNPDILDTSELSSSTRYFVRGHHPPIPDIRIAIQSFQI